MTLTCSVSQAALVDRCAVLGESAAGGERLQALCGVRAGHMAHLHLAALPRRQDWLLGHLPLLQLPGVRSTAVGPCHRLEDCLQRDFTQSCFACHIMKGCHSLRSPGYLRLEEYNWFHLKFSMLVRNSNPDDG